MANKKMDWYLENNDFEGAYERWKATSPCWKKRWFDVCEKIYSSSKEWVKTYVLNPVEKVINKIILTIFTVNVENLLKIAIYNYVYWV